MLTLWSAAAGCNNRMPMCIGSFSLHSKWIGLSKRYPNSSVLRRDVESDRLIGNKFYNHHHLNFKVLSQREQLFFHFIYRNVYPFTVTNIQYVFFLSFLKYINGLSSSVLELFDV